MSGRRSANKQGTTNGVRYAKGDPNGLSSSSSYETAESEAADDVDSDTDSPAPNQTGSGLVNAQHSPDEYRAGSIMHISLRNFVTYDRIEVSPGPNLNMIIGPNGTGKSTIVCAIALGLGEKPSVLGRAKDISEYVKHGHESGSIEITLAGKDGSGPVRIRRDINHQNNTSSWKLNGRAATFSEVSSMTKSMHIQVNNLCQFLPQDRVVEFSKMSPQELLKETQKALGRDDLWDLQKRIVEKRTQERQKLTEIQRLRHDTETLRKQNDVLERDVQRWQERQAAESQMRVLTALIPVVKYTEAKAGHDRRKEERRRAHTNYMEVRNQPGPAEDEIKTLDGKIARNENTRRRRQEERNEFEKEARHQLNQLERLDKTQTDLQNEFEELKKRAQRRREEIRKMREQISLLEASHPPEKPQGETEELKRQIAACRERILEMNNEVQQLQDEQRELMRAGGQMNRDLALRDEELRKLDDVVARRRSNLRSFSEDTFKALEWLEANRSKFKQHVFTPICLEASVQNPQYARVIESIVTMSSLRTFVTQCDDDYYTFTQEVIDRMKLRIDVVSYHKSLSDFNPPLPRDTIRELGFDGYAIDFIEAHPTVLAALCNKDNIHEVPVALGRVDNEAIERKGAFKEYVADATKYTITRGRYGAHSSTVMTARIKPQARLLSSGETEEVQAIRSRLMKEMDELRDQLTENEKKMKKLSIKDRKVRDKHREVESKGQELRKERDRQNKEVSMWETQRLQIETKSAQLTNMIQEERRDAQGTSTAAEQERRRITEMQHENARRRAETIASIAQIVDKLASVIHEIATVSLSGHSDMARLRLLRVEAERYKEAIADAKRQFDEANASYEEAKQHAKRCLEETRSLTEKMTDDERQAVRDLQNQRRDASFEDLEIELSTCQQRLNLASNSGLTARVMEQYEERKQRLQAMHDTLRKAEAELSKVRKKKERLREQWEQPLERLVRQIGATFQQMFDRMDCMGEVRLKRVGDGITAEAAVTNGQEPDSASPHDDEDYDNWGVEIMVSFRRNEPLKPLNNHRQSGGERAVSTILYLQSLQALVAAPFRVVDEINQGMDQRNERLIHRQIVDTACKRGSSQYFLITPKLLPDLDYHPMMKVLCIFNGEWQPEAFNLNKYITNARRGIAAV